MGYIYRKNRMKMTGIYVMFDAGSNKEKEGRYGTMHLSEHLLCKTFINMYDQLTSKGIEWNAYTNRRFIMVYFKGLNSQLTPELKKQLVGKLVGGVENIDENMFEKEKNVVLQEYKDVFNDHSSGHFYNEMRKQYYDFGPIGKYEDIANFKLEDFKEVYEQHFRQPFRIVEIGPEKTEFDVLYKNNLEIIPIAKHSNYIIETEELPKFNKFQYLKLGDPVSKKDFPYMKVAMDMLCKGLNSPFYKIIRVENSLSYFVSGELLECDNNNSIPVFNAATTFENQEKLTNLFNDIIRNGEQYLTQERFEQIINSYKIKREKAKIMEFENPGKWIRKNCMCSMPENLDKIKLEKVIKTYNKYFL